MDYTLNALDFHTSSRYNSLQARMQLFPALPEGVRPPVPPWDVLWKSGFPGLQDALSRSMERRERTDVSKARQIRRSHTTLTGQFVSVKDGMLKQFESPLERDLLAIADFDPHIEAFRDQPLKIKWEDETGKTRWYTPDALIQFHRPFRPERQEEMLLVEVKRQKNADDPTPDDQAKFGATREYCTARGWEFRVLTEAQIRTPYLANARFLSHHRRHRISREDHDLISENLNRLGQTTPQDVLKDCLHVRQALQDSEFRLRLVSTLWVMILLGHVLVDLHAPLTMVSPIQTWDQSMSTTEIPHEWRSPLWRL